jgi:hypothetical protein
MVDPPSSLSLSGLGSNKSDFDASVFLSLSVSFT